MKEIASCAFKYSENSRSYNGSVREIIIPDTVERIGSCPFPDCANLKKLYIYNGTTKTGDDVKI